MPKKPKINNRLDKLFHDIHPEENAAQTARQKIKAERESAAPVDAPPSPPMPARQKPEEVAPFLAFQAAEPALVTSEPAARQEGSAGTSSYSTNIQTGYSDWSTLIIADENAEREWTPDEQLLIQQVSDQLSLALENARLFQEAQERAKELNTLNEMALALSSETDIEQICEIAYQYTSKLMDTKSYFIALYEEKTGEIRFPLINNDNQRIQNPPRRIGGGGLTDHVIRTRETLFIPENVVEHMKKMGVEFIAVGNNKPAQSWLGVPLLIGNRAVGAIVVQSVDIPNLYTERERDLLLSVSGQVATALENARLILETQERANELALINRIVSALTGATQVNEALQILVREIVDAYPVARGGIAMMNEDKQSLTLVVGHSKDNHNSPIGLNIPIKNSASQTVINTRKPYIFENPAEDPINPPELREAFRNLGVTYSAIFPIMVNDAVVGTLGIDMDKPGDSLTQRQIELLETALAPASTAISRLRAEEGLSRRANEMASLAQIGRDISSILNIEEVLNKISTYTLDLLRCTSTAVYIPDTNFKFLQPVATAGAEAEEIKNDPLEIGTGIIGNIALTKIGEINNNVINDPRATNVKGTESVEHEHLMAVPVLTQGNLRGVLAIWRVGIGQEFVDSEFALLSSLAQQLASSLENARLFQEAQERANELSLINRIISVLTGATSLQAALQSVINEVVEAYPVTRGAVTMLDEDKTHIIIVADHSKRDNDSVVGLTIPLKGNLATQTVIDTRKPYAMENPAENPINPPEAQEAFRNMGVTYTAIFPIIVNEAVVGTLGVDMDKPNATLSQRQIDLLETALAPVSSTISRLRAEEALSRRANEMAALAQIGRDISSTLNIENLLNKIAFQTLDLLRCVTSAVYLPDADFKILQPIATAGEESVEVKSNPLTIGTGLIGNVALKKAGEIFNNVSNDPRATTIQGTVSPEHEHLMVAPILTQDNLRGVMAVWRVGIGREFVDSDFAFLSSLAQQIATSLENARLFQEAQKFKLGIDRTDNAVFITDPNGVIQYANPGFEKVYGYSSEEALGKTPRILKSGSISEDGYKNFWATLISGGTISGEILNKTKDGRIIPIFGTNTAILDESEKIIGFLAVHQDISERKKAEEAIRRRNEYLAASSEIGKIVTSTLDLNSIFARTVNLINERFKFYHASIFTVEETGFNAVLREATGAAGAEMKKNKHSLQVNSNSIVGKVTSEGHPVVVNDVLADPLHKVNPLLPETKAETAIPLKIGNRVIGAIDIQSTTTGAFTDDDIAVLQTLADQVAVSIDNAKSFELSQQAVMEMREIDRVKSQFLANMSHELRTPLNSIIGFSRVILKGIDGPVTELQHQDLTAIYNSGQHLLALINDILDSAKIEAGKMELAFDEVNMADITSSVLSTMSGYVKDKPVQLKSIIEPNLPSVRADTIRIRQVMLNLLSNAAKFTDEGVILVNVGVTPGPTGRRELRVSVTDSGPGISPEDQAKLFQAFSQVDDSPTRKTGGTGLGLSICQELVRMHGGRIWVESAVGKGSTFSFSLPLFHKEDEEANANVQKVILAIDDDPQVISLYERYLQPQGYQVVSLSEPARALERVKALKPFAITLDIMMPSIDGWQILDALKSDPETRRIPVIVCSIVDNLDKGFSLGASDYLVKPIMEDDLVNALDRLNADGSIREVLVIDDDPNDLRLLGKILNDDGRYKATLAEGGRKGWDLISSGNPPHAVILDLFMPEMDGFEILEKMRSESKLRDIPVLVISGMELSVEQKNQLNEFGQRLLSKGSFSEKELLTTIQRTLESAQKAKK
jgi:PAS domain S-box-containing protein